MESLSRYKPGSREDLSSAKWNMFFMACYSLPFSEFVFGTRFLSLFVVPAAAGGNATERRGPLRFAYTWLAYSLLAILSSS